MAVETDADRAIFVNADDFGAGVTWTRAGPGGAVATFDAIFDAEYELITGPYLEEGAEGSTPRIVARLSDLPAGATQGDGVAVGTQSFKVVEMKPDGRGMTEVRLQEV